MPDPAIALALLLVIPEENLLWPLLLLLPLSLLVLRASQRSGSESIRRSLWLRSRLGLQPCHTGIPRPAALAAEVPSATSTGFRRATNRNRYAALATLLLSVTLLGATGAAGTADPSARLNKMGHEMICTCGCTQILMECNHVGCPVSPVMINELQTQVSQGGPDNLVLNWFAAKYGATVLAAPMRGGFDNVAWITPLAVFFFATVGVAFLVTVWKKRNPIPVPANSTMDATLRARIRHETEY